MVASCLPVIIKAAGLNASVSTDIQAHTQTNTHARACTQDTPWVTVNPGLWSFKELRGQKSLVLGTQLLFVVGWALPPDPGERWECGDIFAAQEIAGVLGENKNLFHPSQL